MILQIFLVCVNQKLMKPHHDNNFIMCFNEQYLYTCIEIHVNFYKIWNRS
jgi:hypothetical protein